MNPEKRLKYWRIPQNVLFTALAHMAGKSPGKSVSFHVEIPETAQLASVHHDHLSRSFDLLVEDESFPVCPDGAIPPFINAEPTLHVTPKTN